MVQIASREIRLTPGMVKIGEDWWVALREFVERSATDGEIVIVQSVKEMCSPARAGNLLGMSRASVLRRIESGALGAERVGSRWLIPVSEVDRYRQTVEPDRV